MMEPWSSTALGGYGLSVTVSVLRPILCFFSINGVLMAVFLHFMSLMRLTALCV